MPAVEETSILRTTRRFSRNQPSTPASGLKHHARQGQPVIPEVVNLAAFEVIGNDLAITMAAEAGRLQFNAFEPIIARSLFGTLTHLTLTVGRQ